MEDNRLSECTLRRDKALPAILFAALTMLVSSVSSFMIYH